MITATDLELRAGSRILLSDATLRVQPGDRIGLVGRNGAGKTTTMRVLAGEGEPYAGTVTASGAGRLPAAGPARGRPRPSPPRTGCSRPAGWTSCCATWRRRRPRCPSWSTARERRGGHASTGASRSGSPRSAATPRRARPPGSARNLGLPDRVLDQTMQHALGRPAAPRRAGPDPVRGLRRRRRGSAERDDAAARRAHEPPRRRLDHLAALVPVRATTAGSS